VPRRRVVPQVTTTSAVNAVSSERRTLGKARTGRKIPTIVNKAVAYSSRGVQGQWRKLILLRTQNAADGAPMMSRRLMVTRMRMARRGEGGLTSGREPVFMS
jgi:hypothetical protein